MEYGGPGHYYGTGQPYTYMNIPQPLTPHSGEDFHQNRTSPEYQDSYPAVAAHYDPAAAYTVTPNPAAHFGSQNSYGPPTPPNPHQLQGQFPVQPAPGHPQHAPDAMSAPDMVMAPSMAMTASEPEEQGANKPGSEEDESLTPAQSRRKAQNRAAQRAFRERKERHVKDLEAEVALLKAAQMKSASENERLKRDLQKVNTENEILRATTTNVVAGANGPGSAHTAPSSPVPTTTGPMRYAVTDHYRKIAPRITLPNLLQELNSPDRPNHRVIFGKDGQRLFGAAAAWEVIINHSLYERGLVDVEDVSARLKRVAKCDGTGPVFPERDILEAIESSVASGSDRLI